MNDTSQYFSGNSLLINPDKTVAIYYTLKQKEHQIISNVIVGDDVIKEGKALLMSNSGLKWNIYIDTGCKKFI